MPDQVRHRGGVRGDFLTVLRLCLQQSGNAANNRGAAQQGCALLQKFTTSLHLNNLFFVPHENAV